MGKDPAFLFYPGDWMGGTLSYTLQEKGAYFELLMLQFNRDSFTEKQALRILIEDPKIWDIIKDKFKIDSDGTYYNSRLREEKEKRKKYSESRRKNRKQGDNDKLSIYIIKNPINNLIKIGSSVDPERRLIELKKQENKDIYLVCYTEKTTQKKKAELHKKYKHKRLKGDWFDIESRDIINHMTNHMGLTLAYSYD